MNNDVEYIKKIIETWKKSEDWTRQQLLTDKPVLHFDSEIQEKYGLVSYSFESTYHSPSYTSHTHNFYVNLSFFSKNNSLNDDLEYDFDNFCTPVHITVVDGGKIPNDLYIHYTHEKDTRWAENPLADIRFNTHLEHVNVYMHRIQSNLFLKNCNVTLLYLCQEDLGGLKSLLRDNNIITINKLYCYDWDSELLEEVLELQNVKINQICYVVYYNDMTLNFMDDYELYYKLNTYSQNYDVSVSFMTWKDDVSYLKEFTKSALDKKGLKSLNLKLRIYIMEPSQDYYVDKIGIFDLYLGGYSEYLKNMPGYEDYRKQLIYRTDEDY